MANFSSPSNFPEVARILKNRSAAIRSEDDLRCIRNALDPALNEADVVWAALSARQKIALCKHFELKTVFQDEGQSVCVDRRARGIRSGNDSGGLYILVRGRAILSCGSPSLLVHGGIDGGGNSQLGVVLGRLALPSEDAHDFFKHGARSLYHRFVSLQNKQGNVVSIHFEKGSTYIVLPEPQSRHFLDRLNASLIAKRVLNDIGIADLLCTKTHETVCCNDENKPAKVFGFREGQILIKEGDDSDRVLFIATGSCLIFRNNEEQEIHCVGSISSPCFIGITALFGDRDSDGVSVDEGQPVSVVAAADGFAFSFCSLCFLKSFKPEAINAFQFLAQSQMAAWAAPTGGKEEEEEDALTTQNDSVEEEGEIAPSLTVGNQLNILTDKLKFQVEESYKENSVIVNMPKKNSDTSIDADENLLKGKLNRLKFLSAIHETLSNDLSRDVAGDVVHNRETWLLGCNKSNILSDIMQALSKGCGVDFTNCDGNDPFHNFIIDTPADTSSDLQMSLKMPSQMPNRIVHMSEKCLGRKRPPEYDNSDPFLKPCPSVVSRKMHGKTLPMVR
eukprot:CAMPEP_0172317150 /NCGR_PEP_ID=MMETSP1058-20130122/30657_1 /TAXON_ID=83371 /ORGANISM="Detonula confervacea, Strain CCMP 353" /LENGTH=561 /DNA_ID=CAMNT_0013031637 /DNA_START=644 /DNA_END=2326 /DNA_ORIENTATION=+